MKNGVLICAGNGALKNIGDYIQSLASQLFFKHVDCYVEREKLREYSSDEPTKLIINGWFIHNPEQWPPSADIKPLITSLHIVPKRAQAILSERGIEYLRQHQPIGCRDYSTQQLLENHNIEAFYSSCLTLVLGLKYMSAERGKNLVFVDPYFEYIKGANNKVSVGIICRAVASWIRYHKSVAKLASKFNYELRTREMSKLSKWLYRKLATAAFIKSYSSMFSIDDLLDATYICHTIKQCDYDEAGKMALADELMHIYASAKLVVTSRIHCALPCLGVETPVIFVSSDNLDSPKHTIRSFGRFGGIVDLMRTARYDSFKIHTNDELVTNTCKKWRVTDLSNFNKRDFEKYRDALITQCRTFVDND